jgi:predicted nucleotidyltransferase component of viral defense system
MNLHTDKKVFSDAIRAASEFLNINQIFIEKDYWITLVLSRLSKSKYVDRVVFKGGTSLSKVYKLINRFSEDIDLAIFNSANKSGNEIKNLIRSIEKEISVDLQEVELKGVTSKGSKFRKSVFENESTLNFFQSNRLIIEINSFANPYPFERGEIMSFIYEYFQKQNYLEEYINYYQLHPFSINVLTKKQTLLEKFVSLIRFSFAEDPINELSKKIRHFYDLYFLFQDKECLEFINSFKFKESVLKLLEHDRKLFDDPKGWREKRIENSPLIIQFPDIWAGIKGRYLSELSALAFSQIPDEKLIFESFDFILKKLN